MLVAGRPDGRTLAFLSDRVEDGQQQIYLLPADGGETMQLTRFEGDVPTPRGLNPMLWSPKGDMIAFLMTDPETKEERRRKREKDNAIEFLSSMWSDRGVVAGGIFVVAADHASSTRWLQWSDDSKRLVAIAQERGGGGLAPS